MRGRIVRSGLTFLDQRVPLNFRIAMATGQIVGRKPGVSENWAGLWLIGVLALCGLAFWLGVFWW
jgi:hypothetical protein